MAGKKKEATLNEQFTAIEEIIEKLEDTDTSLEDAFSLYHKGMTLLQSCNAQIDRVEKKVMQLTRESGLVEFEEAEDFGEADDI